MAWSSRNSLMAGALLAAMGALAAAACSSDDNDDNGRSGGSGSGAAGSGTGGSGNGTGASPGSGGTGTGSGGTGSGGTSGSGGSLGSGINSSVTPCNGLPYEEGSASGDASTICTGVASEAESLPVDMYIMMDRSSSMATNTDEGASTTRWEGVKTAINQFVDEPSAAGIGVGIGYFPYSQVANDPANCEIPHYSTPYVEIGLLPDNASALKDSINTINTGAFTPTVPAVQGAIQHARDWMLGAGAGRVTVVVLVTDGFPTECSPSISGVETAIKEGYTGFPRVLTFVVGLGLGGSGTDALNLNRWAKAGGSGTALLVDKGDVAGPLVSKLLNISITSLACQYEIPPPPDENQQIDPTKVQVIYTPAVGGAEEIPKVDGVGTCSTSPNGGWYYDNPTDPKFISVCPCTCSRFGAGLVDIRLGCEPKVFVR
jgi:hypothetical protein